jgi:hypothetical protein
LQKEAVAAKHAAEMADMLASAKRLQAAVGSYHNRLFANISNVAEVPFAPQATGAM